jgi:hypothetical protein
MLRITIDESEKQKFRRPAKELMRRRRRDSCRPWLYAGECLDTE